MKLSKSQPSNPINTAISERRERTLKALKYIQKFKHLYRSSANQLVHSPSKPSLAMKQKTEKSESKPKGKFTVGHPSKSTYANPNYKEGLFEKYYQDRTVQPKKRGIDKAYDTSDKMSQPRRVSQMVN